MGALCATSALVVRAQQNAEAAKWLAELNSWRTEHAAAVSAPDGWLSLVALDWLKPNVNSVGSDPTNSIRIVGVSAKLARLREEYVQGAPFYLDEKGNSVPGNGPGNGDENRITITIMPPHGASGHGRGKYPADLMVDGEPLDPNADLLINMDDPGGSRIVGEKIPPPRSEEERKKGAWRPTVLTFGTLTMTVIHRGNNAALRVKDSNAPSRKNFHGLNWYAPNADYRVVGKWIPYSPIKKFSMSTVIGTTVQMPCPGAVEFTLQGKTFRLEPVVEDPDEGRLFFVMRDLSSDSAGKSYPAGRFLYTPYPDHGLDQPGQLVLDFNRLENPPCAYTGFATCPLPARSNRLAIALPVGEQRYHN